MEIKRFDSSEGNVWKYVFDFESAVAEAVLYKYDDFYTRTVLCVSVQCGCPVGCTFCGTGERFVRNLTDEEIVFQVMHCLDDMGIQDVDKIGDRFQIMFMSMGEPMLNMNNLEGAIHTLEELYPNADKLISTMGPKSPKAFNQLLELSGEVANVGLQFSVHEAFEDKRDKLIPFKGKLSLRELRDFGITWHKKTGRPVYLNYCISKDNQSPEEMGRFADLFSPSVFHLTFSVICSADENMKDKGYKNLENINEISSKFVEMGYNVRVFDPAGQDDIGGGCGQLWFTQEWMNKQK